MKAEAIAKLTAECENSKDDKYYASYVAIEEHYTDAMNDRIGEKILQEGKTIQGAYRYLRSYAQRNGIDGMHDSNALPIVDEYYGITADDYKEAGTEGFDILDLI